MSTSGLLNLKSGDALIADISDITATAAEVNTLSGGAAVQKFTETVAFGAFTDGGGAAGTYDLTAGTIPVGARFMFYIITALTGFAGDTSAVLDAGDGTDVDRYNGAAIDVFTTAANGIEVTAPGGVLYHDTAATVTLTITTAADWGSVTAGSVTVEFYYMT